jgi:ABC-type lipoprotein export system ATPase subunit
MISLRNVEKAYPSAGGQVYVLRRINADIAPGEFVTIMGPSGAGKSTLLAVLGMLDGAWTG